MLNIQGLRETNNKIISIGSHGPILQSMLDFDYLAGKQEPDLIGIVATGRKYERLFWGKREILVPVYPSYQDIPKDVLKSITLFINLTSGRRTLSTTLTALDVFPNLLGGTLFAENVPEQHSLEIYNRAKELKKFVVGPASVGLLLPNQLKLGAIGGTQTKQLIDSHLLEEGNVAVLSSSGGMVNELIRLVINQGKRLSFSAAFGGDRFPCLTPKEAILALEKDKQTEYIVYFGELGGYDEYEIAELLKTKKITKKIIAYIAGSISEMFETPPQFGHAKAMASKGAETALAKRKALKQAGVQVAESFTELIEMVKSIRHSEATPKNPAGSFAHAQDDKASHLESRQHALFVNSVSIDEDGVAKIMGQDLLTLTKKRSYAYIVASMLLGKKNISNELEEFTNMVLKLLVDHGPYVSGVVNTMITARAGKDLVSSLAAGLLTIGPRFGGAINEAAQNWLTAVYENKEPYVFVEEFAKKRKFISGIGHRKYRLDNPDPRVNEIIKATENLKTKRYISFALEVQAITTAKKGNLILNVDGAIAAVLLDILAEKEDYSVNKLQETIDTEFFNALFILSRSVGFVAHYLDQRRLDEGLFRLPTDEVISV